MIILSSSGMMVSGRVLAHLKKVLPNSNCAILFCGYTGEDTLATQVKDSKQKYVVVEGSKVRNKAKIVVLNSFSSHACRNELLKRYSTLDYEKIYLIHGSSKGKVKEYFAEDLRGALSKNNKTSKVHIPFLEEEIRF
jgi:metallo-beta-lactamase family protein